MGAVISIVRNPLFILVLVLKIIASGLFISDIPAQLFIPFLQYFGQHPFSNVYEYFFSLGELKAFPYPPLMLIITGIPFFLIQTKMVWLNAFLLKMPLLIADIGILVVLLKLYPKAKNTLFFLYWLSPVIFYINYIHGQLDIIPIFLLMTSLYFLSRERFFLSSLFLGLGIATKTHLLIIVPFYFLYLWKRKHSFTDTLQYSIVSAVTFILLLLPYFSGGLFALVFSAQEQFRVFNLAITYSESIQFYVLIALYLYLVFKAIALRKITKNILYMFIGTTFTFLVTLIEPAQGWYVWCLPFIVYYFARHEGSQLIYWSFSGLYLLYFALIDGSDIFRVFQIILPNVASLPTPYEFLEGFPRDTLVNIVFTVLASSLIYIAYLMHKYGIKSSRYFQESGGIPVIGITGDSGSGKTTLAGTLQRLFGKDQTTIICGDDIHKWERGALEWQKYTHLNPVSNKIHYHNEQIAALRKGSTIYRSHYDHNTGRFTKPLRITARDYIVDEGLHTFVLNKQTHNLKVYIDPDPSLKLYWKIQRDVVKRGYTKQKVLAALRKRKKDSVKYISPQRESADVVVSVKPEKDIKKYINQNKPFSYYLELFIKSDIAVENLLEELRSKSSLSVNLEYISNEVQKITVKGKINKDQLQTVAEGLEVDYAEYGVQIQRLFPNISGLLQLFVLHCLDQRLQGN